MDRDKVYLQDILTAAVRISEKMGKCDLASFLDDNDLQDIVMRQITIMGEAARIVSDETKERFPSIPWHRIAGMRNRLVHEYHEIDLEEVWKTARENIPALMKQIRNALNQL